MSTFTITDQYAAIHSAFTDSGRPYGLAGFSVRLLVALWETGGEARTDELEGTLRCDGSAIRRAYPVLERRGMVTVDASPGTTRPSRGVRARITLTPVGTALATATADTARSAVAA